tara:strand:- start:699 stop:1304 length:606 start_codon:yes stop_codon:yes gene_type:complete
MIGCVLLAGGKSSRMNSVDKTLLEIYGHSLLSIILNKLELDKNKIVLNTNREPEIFKQYKLNIIKDSLPHHQGPLAGILSGLEWFDKQNMDFEWIVSMPIDTPFFPKNLIRKLYDETIKKNKLIGVAKSNGRNHPVFSIWHISLKKPLIKALNSNIRKIDLFTKTYTPVEVEFKSSVDQFFNINTPEDLEIAKTMYKEGHL